MTCLARISGSQLYDPVHDAPTEAPKDGKPWLRSVARPSRTDPLYRSRGRGHISMKR